MANMTFEEFHEILDERAERAIDMLSGRVPHILVLKYVSSNVATSYSEAADALDVSPLYARKFLNLLVDDGLLTTYKDMYMTTPEGDNLLEKSENYLEAFPEKNLLLD